MSSAPSRRSRRCHCIHSTGSGEARRGGGGRAAPAPAPAPRRRRGPGPGPPRGSAAGTPRPPAVPRADRCLARSLANQHSAAGREGRSGGNSWERFFSENHLFLPAREGKGGHRSPRLPSPALPLRGGPTRGGGGLREMGGEGWKGGMVNTNFSSLLAAPLSSPPSFSSSPFII